MRVFLSASRVDLGGIGSESLRTLFRSLLRRLLAGPHAFLDLGACRLWPRPHPPFLRDRRSFGGPGRLGGGLLLGLDLSRLRPPLRDLLHVGLAEFRIAAR